MSPIVNQIIAIIGIIAPLFVAFGAIMWRLGTRVSLMDAAIQTMSTERAKEAADRLRTDTVRDEAQKQMSADIRKLLDSQLLAEGIRTGIAQAHHVQVPPPAA